MDAAALFNERRADVAAFTTLLFQHGGEQSKCQSRMATNNGTQAPHEATKRRKNKVRGNAHTDSSSKPLPAFSSLGHSSASAYRRPASANVPVSRVLREVKARAARRLRVERGETTKVKRKGQSSTSAASESNGAFGFTAQQLREQTYLCMSAQATARSIQTVQAVFRAASKQSGYLTSKQQAQLRRLRIKQSHMRVLPYAHWQLWLRRRRRLWQRRRPVMRRRHLRRCLALQRGRTLAPCDCCLRSSSRNRRTHRSSRSTRRERRGGPKMSVTSRATQWLPSHARLVKRFHHRVVSFVVPLDVVHAKKGGCMRLKATGDAIKVTGATVSSQRNKRRAVPIASVSVPVEPKRKGRRFLQRWVTELGLRQRRLHKARNAASKSEDVSHPPTPLDRTLLADLSHQCVYTITKFRGATGDTAASPSSTSSSSSLSLDAVAQAIGLRIVSSHSPSSSTLATNASAGITFSVAPTARHQRLRESAAAVLHGHMWSATEDSRSTASTRSAVALHRRQQDKRRRVSTLARHTRVVPVVLVCCAGKSSGTSLSPFDHFLLFSEAPVLIPRRADGRLNVQLISAWNPCCRCPVFASVYEYWCWDSAALAVASPATSHKAASFPLTTLRAAQPIRSALERCARVYRRLRRRAATAHKRRIGRKGKQMLKVKRTYSSSRASKCIAGKQKAPKQGSLEAKTKRRRSHTLPRISAIVFPSLPPPFLLAATDSQINDTLENASAPYVWRVGFLYHRGAKRHLQGLPTSSKASEITATNTVKEVKAMVRKSLAKDLPKEPAKVVVGRQLYRVSVYARRAHFQLARRFFGLLLSKPFASSSSSTRLLDGPVKMRIIGLSDRATLMRLVGRPAYPLDYGQSRPSAATQERRRDRQYTPAKCLVTRRGVKRARSTPSPAGVKDCLVREREENTDKELNTRTGHPITSLPSYVHILEYYGNLTNASCRVTVRSAHADKKMLTPHSTVGSILLRCHCTSVTTTTAVAMPASQADKTVMLVEQVGAVSSSPFFAQRFGCVVAPVWCCFPPPPQRMSVLRTNNTSSQQATTSSVGHMDACWTAPLLTASAPLRSHPHMWFVLAPPESASALLRLSASLQRDDPPRQRTSSRRQRAFDLARGRTARKLEAFLCDPTFCSPVQLIQWYA